ncbi:hypothetical protein CRG98_037899 [Punica granatum]|uniref:Uncharacterized protein n=1 Tax=Punica granatum TaxID=22663 RepID=A0A2I0ICI2_PUNGR|nr:hypothetical protein CRG98_037899 [Punica granatum]
MGPELVCGLGPAQEHYLSNFCAGGPSSLAIGHGFTELFNGAHQISRLSRLAGELSGESFAERLRSWSWRDSKTWKLSRRARALLAMAWDCSRPTLLEAVDRASLIMSNCLSIFSRLPSTFFESRRRAFRSGCANSSFRLQDRLLIWKPLKGLSPNSGSKWERDLLKIGFFFEQKS